MSAKREKAIDGHLAIYQDSDFESIGKAIAAIRKNKEGVLVFTLSDYRTLLG